MDPEGGADGVVGEGHGGGVAGLTGDLALPDGGGACGHTAARERDEALGAQAHVEATQAEEIGGGGLDPRVRAHQMPPPLGARPGQGGRDRWGATRVREHYDLPGLEVNRISGGLLRTCRPRPSGAYV